MTKDMGKCSCLHAYVSNGRAYVAYAKDGVIFSLDLVSGLRRKICFGDEYAPIGNGRFLLRTGQKYFITEEIQ